MFLASGIRGWWGECKSILALKLFTRSDVYFDINDILIPCVGGTTQIDHVIVSRHGIFVVESKNFSGRIYGSASQRTWTKVLGGRTYRFQNPLYQNYGHVKALSALLGIDERKFFSVIRLWGNCQVMSELPGNVLTAGYTDFIKSKQAVLFADAEVAAIVTRIKADMLPRTWLHRELHIARLNARKAGQGPCPRCGSPLALRMVRSGARAGTQFCGCTRYPVCRYTRNVMGTPISWRTDDSVRSGVGIGTGPRHGSR